jgi:hypothetical protein
MTMKFIKLFIFLGIISLCASCGVHRENFDQCINPIVLTPQLENQFKIYKPIGLWDSLKESLNRNWTESKLCIEESYSPANSCQKTYSGSYDVLVPDLNSPIQLDGFAKKESAWGLLTYFSYKQSVYYRGYSDNNYFWLSTGAIQLLLRNKASLKATNLVSKNIKNLTYLQLDNKLDAINSNASWPCDPLLVSTK